MIVARDIAHAKLKERLDRGEGLPQYLKDHPIYYAGPAKTPAGLRLGLVRSDDRRPHGLVRRSVHAHGGSLVTLAKGNRSPAVAEACKKHGGFYLGSIGGPAAILAQDNIKKVEVLEYPELGMEAIWKIEVEDFPAFIVVDDKGNDFFGRLEPARARLEKRRSGRLVSAPSGGVPCMHSRWSDAEGREFIDRLAPKWGEDMALRVYTSRLIGRDPDLVMHGGGNTSLKGTVTTLVGDETEALFVKGSGWDLDAIEPPGLPAVDLAHLRELRRLRELSDPEMVNQLRTHLFDAGAPNPSVETLLHAFLPHKFIDHTHADIALVVTNQPADENEALVREAFGAALGGRAVRHAGLRARQARGRGLRARCRRSRGSCC